MNTEILVKKSKKGDISAFMELLREKQEHFGGGLSIDYLDDNSIIAVCLPGANIKIDKVMFSPINTSILLNGNYTNKNKVREDEMGIFPYSDWFVFDDKGIEIAWKGSSGGTKGALANKFNYKYDFEVLKNIPKYLKVVPYKFNGNGKKEIQYVTKPLDSKYPIELNQGKIGKLIIKEVKNEGDKTIIKYRAEGKVPYFQAQRFSVKDELGEWIEPYEGYLLSP
ncbi:hypothetical protein SAMN05216497_11026 [Clostridium cochlearium]|uniref:DUF5643 domain-containing protein n=1 Tax=Clostridium cochlearium TaxID=1494 RepID=A0ABY0QLJ1_CLOCO|nr:DUF5643 domain-containing protein [Clostridium cochlearium]SDL16817.1 hypothetical protein SAMN05216497_11026 [Clostridium cochlearium]